MENGSKITIQQVADKAGVSIATVSRVLNNKNTVREDTRKQVLEVAEGMGFNASSSLADNTSRAILLCVPDLINPFNSSVIEGIQQSAHQNHYRVFILQSKEKYLDYGDYEEALKNHSFAGIILLTSIMNTELLELLTISCPIVMCSEYCDVNGVSFVSIDDVKSACRATEYLISLGCRKLALLNFSLQFRFARHREQGFDEALQKAGLEKNPDWIAHLSSIDYQLAYSNALHILSLPDPPDACFAVSDVYAVAMIHAAKKSGFRVPGDLSVIGFDNIDLASMTDPSITTMAQPGRMIGFQASELLIEKINNPRMAKKRIILNTELIVRESTARL
ncbi:LacI family transcriptional regulator [Spirochaetia bacterium]|nr:LacI family transcriptional regulator [Spirochaetia bacterium]